ncbi:MULTISPECIES: hypothetical protein [unclassified Ruegeria]|uniref:hypothetical protein n=1 Tax=unclassified Ruegeria TaxID=2625375 RepID=UPI0014917C9A|nr:MULTISPECIES: hypothetical protein [unclassified Ruegeria]NOD49785.1 hypothetical protein [Ruegeria sp. HKCCD5849]NOD54113.1 hypothetical protein [Ruegeria sp. HKCCD5851]NOD70116.1 hypothetical protein [Ruegeria sp. HKCCD7303]
MTAKYASQRSSRWLRGILLFAATIIVCLAVLIINRGPLFYFDTGSYFKQGDAALSLISPISDDSGKEIGTSRARAEEAGKKDQTTVGSRSMAYALLVAAFWRADALGGVAGIHLAMLLLAVWLAVQALQRSTQTGRSTLQLMSIPLLAAATTSLPFYIAYIMPDIFTSVILILIATVVAAGRHMHPVEWLGAFALAGFAVVLHPSHFGIAVLMVPFAILAALLRFGHGRWLAVAFITGLVGLAIAERKAFELAAETVTKKEVLYTPHITARLIVDGPGLAYLEEVCPRDDLATCALHEALSWSNDPYRLTATHIIFERSENLGSFRLMPIEDQQAVAAEQRDFFLRVLAARPFGTIWALGGNAVDQLGMNSVEMTIPNESVTRNAKSLSGLPEAQLAVLDDIVLMRDQSWLGAANAIHSAIYLISAASVIVLLLWPGRIEPPLKLFALFILIGIAVNALVCGGVSQPADRYGARVMWLLPFTAAFLFLVQRSSAPQDTAGETP